MKLEQTVQPVYLLRNDQAEFAGQLNVIRESLVGLMQSTQFNHWTLNCTPEYWKILDG